MHLKLHMLKASIEMLRQGECSLLAMVKGTLLTMGRLGRKDKVELAKCLTVLNLTSIKCTSKLEYQAVASSSISFSLLFLL